LEVTGPPAIPILVREIIPEECQLSCSNQSTVLSRVSAQKPPFRMHRYWR